MGREVNPVNFIIPAFYQTKHIPSFTIYRIKEKIIILFMCAVDITAMWSHAALAGQTLPVQIQASVVLILMLSPCVKLKKLTIVNGVSGIFACFCISTSSYSFVT
jgi:hypothetical protein